MELKDFLQLIKRNSILFISLVALVIWGGLFIRKQQNELYSASLPINIARNNSQKITQDYQYDQFYRLQADEKFGKNIVSWLSDPTLMKNVHKDFLKFKKGQWSDIRKIKATQLSSNFVKVDFESLSNQSAIVFGEVLKINLKERNQELDSGQKSDWFKLIVGETYVVKNQINLYLVLLISTCLGILSGILAVVLKHYFLDDENRD